MNAEFPTVLSSNKTEKTQNECPCGLFKLVIVLFGITNTSKGAIIGLKSSSGGQGDNYLVFWAHEGDVINCSFIIVSTARELSQVVATAVAL